MENSVVYDRIDELKQGIKDNGDVINNIYGNLPKSIRDSKPINVRNTNISYGTQNLELVNVQGKGTLFYAVTMNPYTGWSDTTNLNIKIVVDDLVIDVSSSASRGYNIGYLANECVLGDGSSTWNVEGYTYYGDSEIGAFYVPATTQKLYRSNSTISASNTLFLSEYGLSFNEQLKVIVSNNNGSSKSMRSEAFAYYSLAE